MHFHTQLLTALRSCEKKIWEGCACGTPTEKVSPISAIFGTRLLLSGARYEIFLKCKHNVSD